MMQNLMEAEPQDILLNTFTKKTYMVLKKETVLVHRLTLFDIKGGEDLTYQIDEPNGIVLDKNMQLIEPHLLFNRKQDVSEFNKVEKDFAERYLITTTQHDRILGLIQQLNNPNPYPTIFEATKSEKGTLTTQGKI